METTFPRYTAHNPAVPIYCLTPGEGRVIHRFFDTSPISPSGRYAALTRLPFEDRSPRPGDAAQVIIIDLLTGAERIIAETRGWDTQLGAQVQWGATDNDLFFNDMTPGEWKPFGVHHNLETGESRRLQGTIYHVSPDGRHAISPCLLRMSRTQLGYGVLAPPGYIPENKGAPDNDGLYITDLENGESRLLVPLNEIVQQHQRFRDPMFSIGSFYGFHAKWNPQGTRIMFVIRWTPAREKSSWLPRFMQKSKPASKKSIRKFVMTMAPDGTDIQMAISDTDWAKGGHHPNWHPDGERVAMNLNLNGDGLRFVSSLDDGMVLELLHPTAVGSGHPSVHPGGRHILTDAYPGEPAGYSDGTVPIRLIDLTTGKETVLARIQCRPDYVGNRKEMRVDAHPAWDHTGSFVIFNACPDGTRRVYLADLRGILE